MSCEEAEAVAKRLRLYRASIRKNQFEAAAEIGISVEELSKLERCCTDPKLSTLKKTADYMGISVPALLTPERAGTSVFGVLHGLGITAKYAGYFQMVQAVEICLKSTDKMTLITKLVYAEVGKKHGVHWTAVERNIRTVVRAAWKHNPTAVEKLMGTKLTAPPKSSQFITAMTEKLRTEDYSFLSD